MKASRTARDAGGCALATLPDHLLELCLPCEGDGWWEADGWHLTTLRLVCKRWKRVFDSSPRLTRVRWDISPDYHLGKNGAVWDTAALPRLAAYRAGVVQEACFEGAQRPGRLEAVQQLTALTSLTLAAFRDDVCDLQQPGQELAQRQLGLGALPQLRRLSIDVACLLGPSCAQLSEARHLTSLEVQGFLYAVPGELWEAIACLPALSKLGVGVHTCAGDTAVINGRAWECLAACSQLTHLKLGESCVDGALDEPGNFALLPGTTRLTALRSLVIDGKIASLGDLWQHNGLTRLVLLTGDERFPEPLAGSVSLPALREAAVGNVSEALPPFWDGLLACGLRHVTRLLLCSCSTNWDGSADDVAFEQLNSLMQLKGLHTLRLDGVLNCIPDTVRGLTSLKLLDVSHCDLRELPEGPYLPGLRTLLMQGHQLERLPPALAAARSLEVLDVTPTIRRWRDTIEPGSPLLLLQPSDLSLLAGMPALRMLCLPLYEEMFEGGEPSLQAAAAQHRVLAAAFCALLPQLTVASHGAAYLPGMSHCCWPASLESGLRPVLCGRLQDCAQLSWAALSHEEQQQALGMLRQAVAANQLSPPAAALLAAFPPAKAAEPS